MPLHVMKGELPDLFRFQNGRRVRTDADWRCRREELITAILDIEYGHLPPKPENVRGELLHWHNVKRMNGLRYATYRIVTEGGAHPFWFFITVMTPPGDGPFPVVINGDCCWRYVSDSVIEEVISHGYMLVTFNRTEIVPDNYDPGRNTGLYLVYPDGDFRALSAWAWGYHRVIDFLATQKLADSSRLAVVGHSRGGKAVLLAGATDERIGLTAPNDSGSGGAGSFRWQGSGCEKIEDGIKAVPYWYSPRFRDYIGREEELPFDQHSLKALVAPRALLSTEALRDLWGNPSGTCQTYRAAREIYRFLGAPERIGIWFRDGEHSHGLADWKAFLDFADQQFMDKNNGTRFDIDPFPEMPNAFSWSAPAAHAKHG